MRFLAKANVAAAFLRLSSPPFQCYSQQHSRATRYINTNFICPRFNRMIEGGRSFIHYLSTLEQLKSGTQEFCINRIFHE